MDFDDWGPAGRRAGVVALSWLEEYMHGSNRISICVLHAARNFGRRVLERGIGWACINAARAQPVPRLGELFRDHAVLQRERPIAVWGHAAAHELVTVSLAGSSVRARADDAGVWRATLPAMPAGGPFVLSARSASGAVAASDVLLGDVFLCSGQSNMAFPVQRADDAPGRQNGGVALSTYGGSRREPRAAREPRRAAGLADRGA